MDIMHIIGSDFFDKSRGYRDFCPKEFEDAYDLFAMRLANEPISLDVIESHRQMVLALRYLKQAGMSSVSEITENGLIKAFYIYEGEYSELARPVKELIKLLQSERLMNNDFRMPTAYDVCEYDRSMRLKAKSEERLKFEAIDISESEELMNRAISLLAVKTGASARSICNLKLIPANEVGTRLVKSGHLNNPYPTDVGKAINEYITKGRPKIDFEYLFMRPNFPPRPLRLSTVEAVIDRALENQRLENESAN
ncbi:MAG: hypothetical protein LBT59_02540 [Clostridiales bacterium]|jgi:hypothetical protein|nr:hypothetical protein [Clostridiales bacterium]